MQKWFASTEHPHAGDVYFLYGASNAGSMLGLLGYIVFVEPTFLLKQQAWLWTVFYGGLVFLITGCAWFCGARRQSARLVRLTTHQLLPKNAPLIGH